jgi:SAM-dependent methyltransferase
MVRRLGPSAVSASSVGTLGGVTNQDKIWDHFQLAHTEAFADARPRLDYLLRQARRKAGPRPTVLTVGVGDGYLERTIHDQGWLVTALDPVAGAAERLSAEGIDARQGVMEAMPFSDASFDVVIATEVLEHLSDVQGDMALAETARVLRRSGWFVGTVPANEDLTAHARTCPNCGHTAHHWGHQRSFTADSLRTDLRHHFAKVDISVRAFPDFKRTGAQNLAKSTARWLLGRAGSAVSDPKLAFAAQR